jgi:putative zinc finger/helix-turn-helix YgiT family protein
MRCAECESELKLEHRDYQYTESGLRNITLPDAPVYVCPRHGVQAVVLREVAALHEDIARAILDLKRPLRGPEVRFLRKQRGWSQTELARRLSVSEVTVSRWETEATPIGPANQQRLHFLYRDPEGFEALELADAVRRGAIASLRIPLRRPHRTATAVRK